MKTRRQKMKVRKGILLILDGYGEGEKGEFNAVENANTPYLKDIKVNKPNCLVRTDGRYVGLPENTLGGSEVGHMTIGSGKINRSMQVKVDDEVESGDLFKQPVVVKAFERIKQTGGSLHLGGLWSDMQVHSNINHCFALMKMAKMFGINKVFVHAFTDGRDCAPMSCNKYFSMFSNEVDKLGVGEIATIGGRFYIMDRENNLDRTKLAIDKMLEKDYDVDSVETAVNDSYQNKIFDEFIKPVRVKTKEPYALTENDLFIFFNTRGDRMKQPVKMASQVFDCPIITLCDFITAENVTHIYDEDFIKNTLCEYLSKAGLKQLKISESTKYAHVTYFFNGGKEEPFPNEDRIHIITEKTNDYALTPFMRAREVCQAGIDAIKEGKYDSIIINISNPDMVGHTGNYDATVKSLECVDECVKSLVETAQLCGYFVLVCADHGNAECMRDKNGVPMTAHTLNPVKCVIIDKENENAEMHNGGLQDIAPTFLKLMNLEPNPEFDGKPLF